VTAGPGWDSVIIGLASLSIAGLAYTSSGRARTAGARTGHTAVEAQAWDRARLVYENALRQQEHQIAALNEKVAALEARTGMLETVIRDAGLPVPPSPGQAG